MPDEEFDAERMLFACELPDCDMPEEVAPGCVLALVEADDGLVAVVAAWVCTARPLKTESRE
jgi:hypothetical protein